eukprot:COSAG06_NODE_60932_length_269_cov_0.694118_1_plen_55_part_10
MLLVTIMVVGGHSDSGLALHATALSALPATHMDVRAGSTGEARTEGTPQHATSH